MRTHVYMIFSFPRLQMICVAEQIRKMYEHESMCTYMHIYTLTHTNAKVYTYTHVYIHIYVNVYTYVYVCLY